MRISKETREIIIENNNTNKRLPTNISCLFGFKDIFILMFPLKTALRSAYHSQREDGYH